MVLGDPKRRGLWDRVVSGLATRRLLALIVAVLLTAGSLVAIKGVAFNSDPTEYFPRDEASVKFWLELTHRFGASNIIMVGLEENAQPLNPASLARLAIITNRLAEQKARGVLVVRSLTNLPSITEGEDGTINTELLVPAIPQTPEELERLKTRVKADAQALGSLVSRDLMGYTVLVTTDPKKDSREVYDLIRQIVDQERGQMHAVYYGMAVASNYVTSKVFNQLGWLVPAFALLLLGVLILWLRRPVVIAVILFCSALPLVWWFGMLYLFHFRLTATAMNAALLLLVSAAAIFAAGAEGWLSRSRDEEAPNPFPGRIAALLIAAAVAFGALSTATLPYLAELGRGVGAGMLAIVLVGLFVYAPLVTWLEPRSAAHKTPKRISPVAGILLFLVLLLGGLAGASQLKFFVTPDKIFSQRGDIAEALSFYDRRFGGSDFLQVYVKGDLRDPAACARVMRLTDLLEGAGIFSDVRSFTQVLGMLGEQFSGLHRIPNDRNALANLWFFLEGNEDVRALVTDERNEAMLAGRVPGQSTMRSEDWVAAAEKAIEQSKKTGPEGAVLRLKALRDRYGLAATDGKIEEVVAQAGKPESEETLTKRREHALEKLHHYMNSPASPFAPKEEEWSKLAAALADPATNAESLKALIADMSSYKELDAPEDMAGELATTILVRMRQVFVELRSTELAQQLLPENEARSGASGFAARLRGVFADLIEGSPDEGKVEFAVSGLPAIAPKITSELLLGTLFAALMVWVLLGCLTFGITRSVTATLLAMAESLLACALTLCFGWVFGVQVDAASSTLYMVPAVLGYFLSPRIVDGGDLKDGIHGKMPLAFAVAFAAAALTLVFTGIAPVMRLGAVLALGLIFSSAIAAFSRRIRAKD